MSFTQGADIATICVPHRQSPAQHGDVRPRPSVVACPNP